MQQQFNISKETAKLVGHHTLAQFSSHLRQLLRSSGFDKFIYYALPVHDQMLDKALNYCTVGLKEWMQDYLLDNHYKLDPLRTKLLSGVDTLKFQLNRTEAVYQPFSRSLTRNREVLEQICFDAHCMQLHTSSDTQVICRHDTTIQPLIDHFIAHDLHQGIGLMLNNYRSMLGIIYLGYGGSSESFATAYTYRKFALLERFIRRWHHRLQHKFAKKFIGKMSIRLTSREQDIIELLAHGYTNPQIVTNLGISFSTVRTHINNILAKFQARNITHACVLALHMGLLD